MLNNFTLNPRRYNRKPLLLALLFMAAFSTANAQSTGANGAEAPRSSENTAAAQSSSGTASGASTGVVSGLCERPQQWLYAKEYEEGDMAFHGSKVWKAIDTTKGDMPGMNKPPLWVTVDDHCSMTGQ